MKLKQKINQWRGNYSLLSKGQKMFLKASVTLNLLAINYIVWVIIFIPAVQAKMIEVLEIDKIQTEIIVNQSEELSMEEWVLTEVRKAGLNSNKVWAIIQAESAWREDICIIEPNNTISCGLWQLNTIHNKNGLTNACKVDYKCATKWSIEKILRDGNYCAWLAAKSLGLCN